LKSRKNIVRVILSAIFAVALLASLMGCTSSSPTPTTAQPNMIDRIAANEAQVQTLTKSKADLETRLTTVESAQIKQTTKNDELQTQVKNVEKQVSTIQTGQIPANMATKDEFNSLKTQLDTTNKTIAELQKQTTDFKTQLEALKSQSTGTSPTSDGTSSTASSGMTSTMGKVTVKVTSYNGTIIPQGTYDFVGNTYSVSSINVVSGGSGYTPNNPPTIKVSGGYGSGVVATAILDDSGHVDRVTILDGGSGYLNTASGRPSIQLLNNNYGTGNTAVLSIDSSNMTLTGNTFEPTITLKITNGETFDINNLIFDITLYADNDLNSTNLVNKLKLTGSNASFRSTYADTQEFDFETSGNGLSISAGKTKYVYITPSILLKTANLDSDISFDVSVKIVDFVNAN